MTDTGPICDEPGQEGSARSIGGYALLDCPDRDSLENVFRVRQGGKGPLGVLKILAPGLLSNTTDRESFLRETRAVSALKHDALVPVLDAGFHQDRPYVVTEWQDGGSALEEMRERGRMTEARALRLIEGVALGLQYGWEQARVIHGHLTPESIRINSNGNVRLADLGLARAFSSYAGSGSGTRGQGMPFARGASHYASPEQAAGVRDLDFRADVYSLGAVLYHLLTGIRPFDSESDSGALAAHAIRRLADPQTVRPDLSPEAAWLIEKMMLRDRDRRPATWSDVLADIDEVAMGGVPFGDKPGVGDSVVERCPSRETQMARVVPRKAAPNRKPKVRVVVPSAPMRTSATASARSPGVPLGWAVLVAAAALSGVAYIYFQYIAEAPPPWAASAPVREDVRPAPDAPSLPSAPRTTPRPSVTERPAATPRERLRIAEIAVDAGAVSDQPTLSPSAARPDLPAYRRHPLFIQGARDFNAALALFKRYEANPSAASDLTRVEQLSEQSADAFQRLKERFPRDAAAIDRFLDQAYGMSRYARQSMLMSGNSLSSFESTKTARPALQLPKRNPNVALAPEWRTPVRHDGLASEEMRELLSTRGVPRVDLTPKPSVSLLQGVAYLMPVEEVAAQVLRRPTPDPVPLQYSAYPYNSLQVYTFTGLFDSRFSRLRVIADREGKTVGLHLWADQPENELWLPELMFNSSWKVADFLEGRRITGDQVRVAHRLRSSGGVVRIDTEVAEQDEGGGLARSISRSSLILPQQIVDLMVLRLSAGW